MKKNLLLLCATSLLAAAPLQAQTLGVHPVPHEYTTPEDSIAMPRQYRLTAGNLPADSPTLRLLRSVMPGETAEGSFRVYIGTKGDKSVKEYASKIPARAEGYYLKIEKDYMVIAGADERGTYYGVQTLAQLAASGSLPVVEITDYPDIPYRGVVEGFYGTPWSHEARLRQLEFYGRNKMNVYLYGPKDDPYHSTPDWRKPYPPREADQLKQLVAKAKENNVIFYWAIHPGQDIRWNDEDRSLLLQKFESMYGLGIRGFAVFFDDISGEGTKADRQVELLNYIDDHFVKAKKDVAPLVMCPTEYNKSWVNLEGGYLATLGKRLNPGIQIMWTGDKVVETVSKQTLEFVNPLLQRKAFIWWNYPVTDYACDHLALGPVYGNSQDIADDMAAFVSNPMEFAEASKIALYGIADYVWNMKQYDSKRSWKHALKDLMTVHSEYLEVFASHNCDFGKNGHNFHRDESWSVKPALDALLKSYKENGSIDKEAYAKATIECGKLITAADMLLASGNENRPLIDEIRPWLIQSKLAGEYGKEVLRLLTLTEFKDTFAQAHAHAKALQRLMTEVDATYNQASHRPGVKVGSRYLMPALDTLFAMATERYNGLYGTRLDTQAAYMPYSMESDVSQLASLLVSRRGKTGSIASSNEIVHWQADGTLTFSMDYPRVLASMLVDLGSSECASSFTLEASTDGKAWQPVTLRPEKGKTQLRADVDGMKALKLRLRNTSGTKQQVRFKTFSVREK